jgi:hypothetical protein
VKKQPRIKICGCGNQYDENELSGCGHWKTCPECGKRFQGAKHDHSLDPPIVIKLSQVIKPPKVEKPPKIKLSKPEPSKPDPNKLRPDGLPEKWEGLGGFVYLIQAEGTDIYKIGISKDVRYRLKALQTSSPVPLKMVSFQFTDKPFKQEEKLHEHFAGKRIHGEWFRLDPDDVVSCLSLM